MMPAGKSCCHLNCQVSWTFRDRRISRRMHRVRQCIGCDCAAARVAPDPALPHAVIVPFAMARCMLEGEEHINV